MHISLLAGTTMLRFTHNSTTDLPTIPSMSGDWEGGEGEGLGPRGPDPDRKRMSNLCGIITDSGPGV